MTMAPAPPIEQRLLGMAAAIRRLIPAAEVRLYSCGETFGYGSRARSEAARRSQQPGSLVQEAIREGVVLDALP